MIARIWRSLVSLQGKLTLSYVLVTVLTTVVMQAVLVMGLVLYSLYSDFIPGVLAYFAGDIASDLQGKLHGQQTSAEALEQIYRRRSTGEEGIAFTVEPARNGELRGDLLVTVVDNQGLVITSSQPLSYTPNVDFSSVAIAPEREVVQQALTGITQTSAIGSWLRPDNVPIAAYPVLAADGTVSGAVYVRAVYPVAWPSLEEFATLLGISALGFTCAAALAGTLFGYLTARPFTRRLADLTAVSGALAAGDLGKRVHDDSSDEIGQLGRQFNQMSEQLEQTVRSLRLMADRNAQLAEQAGQLAIVEERNRLARDLHDSVSQQLFSITMLAAATRSLMNDQPQQAEEYLHNLQNTAQQALHETRTLIHQLRPATLNSKGLGPALREHVQAFRDRERIAVELHIDDERRLPLAHELALFRIAQEALSNITRHARAETARIELRYSADAVSLEIIDDGVGFQIDAAPHAGAVGLSSMAERAHELGGNLQIDSQPGSGTRIVVQLPVIGELVVAG